MKDGEIQGWLKIKNQADLVVFIYTFSQMIDNVIKNSPQKRLHFGQGFIFQVLKINIIIVGVSLKLFDKFFFDTRDFVVIFSGESSAPLLR